MMPGRTCEPCRKERDVKGGKVCPKEHFACAESVYGSGVLHQLLGARRKSCPLAESPWVSNLRAENPALRAIWRRTSRTLTQQFAPTQLGDGFIFSYLRAPVWKAASRGGAYHRR